LEIGSFKRLCLLLLYSFGQNTGENNLKEEGLFRGFGPWSFVHKVAEACGRGGCSLPGVQEDWKGVQEQVRARYAHSGQFPPTGTHLYFSPPPTNAVIL
jgi:hypothetical protein